MTTRILIPFVASLLAVLAPAALPPEAEAHTALAASQPASGSVLTASPERLTLTFIEPARLTSLVLVTASGDRRLAFTPEGSARSFSVARPALALGRNEVRWRALSQDGHVIEGSIILVLRRPAS